MDNYKKTAKLMNDEILKSKWDDQRILKIEHTAFNPLHRVSSGRNQVSKMLELQTVLTEGSAIYFETEPKYNSIDLYVDSNVKVEHGFGRYKGIFIRLKDAKGKYHSLSTKNEWERHDIQVDRFLHIFDIGLVCTFTPNKFESFLDEANSKVIKLVDSDSTPNIYVLQREYAKKLFQDLVAYDLDYNHGKEFEKLCAHCGITIVRKFQYVQKFHIFKSDFINVSSKSIEIGWTKSNTYNSLPEVVKITLVKEIKFVKLADLGVEGAGYYSHDDRMTIPSEQTERAKQFMRRFQSVKSKILNKLLKSA